MDIKDKLNSTLQGFNTPVKLEDKPRLSEKVLTILNVQIQKELESANLYKSMSAFLNNKGYVNASKLFTEYGKEEMSHMDKIIDYLYDRNCKVDIPGCVKPISTFNDIKDICYKALEHEMLVTSQWESIAKAAKDENDSTTFHFAEWFLKEQIEEEDKFRDIIYLLNLGLPMWKLELMFKDGLK